MSDFQAARASTPFVLGHGMVDSDAIIYTKLEILAAGGNTHKCKCPTLTFDKGSDYIMYCLDEFDNIAETYTFDNHDNWLYFRQILETNVRQLWDDELPAPANQNAANFTLSRTRLLQQHFPRHAYQNFMNYIRIAKKPNNMSARKLRSRVQTLFRYAARLPSGHPIAQQEQRRLFIYMFPQTQIDSLERARQDPLTMSLSELAEFFTTYERSDINANGKRIRGGDRDNSRNSRYRGRNGRFTSRRSQSSSGQSSGTTDRSTQQRQGQSSDMCRYHAHLGDRNHKWIDCIFNPRSANYRPDLRPPDRRPAASSAPAQQQQQNQQPGSYMTQFPLFYPVNAPLQQPHITAPALSSYYGQFGLVPASTTPPSVILPSSNNAPSSASVITHDSSQPPASVPIQYVPVPYLPQQPAQQQE